MKPTIMSSTPLPILPPPKAQLATTWPFLEEGVDHIMTKLHTGLSFVKFSSLYTVVYNHCTSSSTVTGGARLAGSDLYHNLIQYFITHLKPLLASPSKTKPSSDATPTNGYDTAPEGLEPLRNMFEEHVKKSGLAAVEKLVGGQASSGGGTTGADGLDPKAYVDVLLDVHKKNSEIVTRSFRGEAGFVASLDRACREFVNRNAVTGSSNTRSPELLAKCADLLLRKSNKLAEEDDLEFALGRVMIFFKYIEDNDVFQAFYTIKRSKRLIHDVSASDESEASMMGRTDNKSIVLMGDSPEHFLWALYALLPTDDVRSYRPPESPTANLDHLIDITRLANKYSFKSMETWALNTIQDYVNRKPSPILSLIPPPHAYTLPGAECSQNETANQLTRLVRLAHHCQHDRLMGTMISMLRQLMSSSVQYAYLAMSLSDELGLRSLRGAAYLEVIQKGVVLKKAEIDVFTPLSQSNTVNSGNPPSLIQGPSYSGEGGTADSSGRLTITREQQLRLFAGFYRLTSLWDKLRASPPHFDHAHSCGATWNQQGCTQSWLEFWKEKTRSDNLMNLGLADIVGRLKLLQKNYDQWGSATYMHVDCRSNAKKAIGDIIKRVEDKLPDFFDESGGCDED